MLCDELLDTDESVEVEPGQTSSIPIFTSAQCILLVSNEQIRLSNILAYEHRSGFAPPSSANGPPLSPESGSGTAYASWWIVLISAGSVTVLTAVLGIVRRYNPEAGDVFINLVQAVISIVRGSPSGGAPRRVVATPRSVQITQPMKLPKRVSVTPTMPVVTKALISLSLIHI